MYKQLIIESSIPECLTNRDVIKEAGFQNISFPGERYIPKCKECEDSGNVFVEQRMYKCDCKAGDALCKIIADRASAKAAELTLSPFDSEVA